MLGAKLAVLLLIARFITANEVLNPPDFHLQRDKKVTATATCGQMSNGAPVRELYCSLAGADSYSPIGRYGYHSDREDHPENRRLQELRIAEASPVVQGGQNCEWCDASSSQSSHAPENMVDGGQKWWQSPPLSRGMHYNQVNITLDLEQEFQIAYVIMIMANSPRPGVWALEHSTDNGETWKPWQYFAQSNAQCEQYFGPESLAPILEDDSVICTTEYSKIVPLGNGEIFFNLMQGRPNAKNFTHSQTLQRFTRATNVRIRLLNTNTLQSHLMDPSNLKKDPTITRRYFYAIKELILGGRCVCNGHAKSCDILDPNRPTRLLCRCEHNTCGDQCDRCCAGFEQKKWQSAREGREFKCEACNCHGHSETCQYDAELDRLELSLDVGGAYSGGGRCLECQHNTEGINCHQCSFGFYRPEGKALNATDVCQPCQCDPYLHTGACAEITGLCECRPRFIGPDCSQCAPGYYSPPECKPCDCSVNGTEGDVCLPAEGQCPCKDNYVGVFCDQCAAGFHNFTDGCKACQCSSPGSLNQNCSALTGQCVCANNYAGLACDQCASNYYNYPSCDYCDCDPSGTEPDICDKQSGQCLCKEGYAGDRCDTCNGTYFGYPSCQSCACDLAGAASAECDSKTGQCQCGANFTARACDQCSPGYYNYPNCLYCDCLAAGSKGITCNDIGVCYCKDNFAGQHCGRCAENFYNFPICEECNCDPRGVSADFAGCDKVPAGELCTCKRYVTGRICDQCLATFWNLDHNHETGCIDCGCSRLGTLSGLNECLQKSGQCPCKLRVTGRTCNQCQPGFYALQNWNQHGCQSCKCDVGGSISDSCEPQSGQCHCKARISGQMCDQPAQNHYFPDLWHLKFEAEDGQIENYQPVRYAIDEKLFPKYSWKGYAVFSPIQDEILLEIDIQTSSVYRLLLHYVNPTEQTLTLKIEFEPFYVDGQEDVVQSLDFSIPPSPSPTTQVVRESSGNIHPFVLNPGRWTLHLITKQRLYLDYVVLLPAEYYEADLLQEQVREVCTALEYDTSNGCLDMRYAPLNPDATVTPEQIVQVDYDGNKKTLPKLPDAQLPSRFGSVAYVSINSSDTILAEITVPEANDYVIVLEYYTVLPDAQKLWVDAASHGKVHKGKAVVHSCPYSKFCREAVVSRGSPISVYSSDSITVNLTSANGERDFGLAAIYAVAADKWLNDYLLPSVHCIRKSGVCTAFEFVAPEGASVFEAEMERNVDNSISGEELPFPIADADNTAVVSLDESQATVEINGTVPISGHYIFIVHYFNSKSSPADLSVLLQSDQLSETQFKMEFCPNVAGCRAVLKQKQDDVSHFYVSKTFVATFLLAEGQDAPIYIDKLLVVPFQLYSDTVLEALPVDRSTQFLTECATDNFRPDYNTSLFCEKHIFSLTVGFNHGAQSCDCDPSGSTSYQCNVHGGQCPCKANVVGRQCQKCRSGYYGFPDCKRCECGHKQCDEQTGQCSCPLYVEGRDCEKCRSDAYGYDPLIGCQLCQCHPEGSAGPRFQCDPDNGQCLCKNNAGGRKCEQCVPGHYGFPFCYNCQCQSQGTAPEVCDQNTAQCICKENVYGQSCQNCQAGTFNLEATNIVGCTDCYCFEKTDTCRSSILKKLQLNSMQDWSSNLPEATVSMGSNGLSAQISLETANEEDVYFEAPETYLGNMITSYGGMLSYTISSQKADDSATIVMSPDVILKGRNFTLEHYSSQQPAEPETPFEIILRFVPEEWSHKGSGRVTRAQLMELLNDLQSLQIKASYYKPLKSAKLERVSMDTADPNINAVDLRDAAVAVEACECPAPYSGSSCQECADGYYRANGGSKLDACVPCQCNGHTGQCDKATGLCIDCQHDTWGAHCEICMTGFYGNSTHGTPHDCRRCPCPMATEGNNFASQCEVDMYGQPLMCYCMEGYTGATCDRCDVGFYGQPTQPDSGSCTPCDCNNNNNLTDPRSCDPRGGTCYNCQHNTAGSQCELCDLWFHGDAVTAKNCTNCTCDQCGSSYCDHQSGECFCKQNVQGINCDACLPDTWGLSSCQGCQECHCGLASLSTQCDLETGQCPCAPGADGKRCERCEYGYWDYGSDGCTKCDCEADLSMGTVCDVLTGQCQCQQGATGPRCDSCIKDYLRIPELGCRYCDECVHVLNADFDLLEQNIVLGNDTLANVSTAALTGARLNRVNNTLNELRPKTEALVKNAEAIGLPELADDVDKLQSAVGNVVFRAERSLSNANGTLGEAETLLKNANLVAEECRSRAENAMMVVRKLSELANNIGQDSSATLDRQKLVEESEKLLTEMETTTFSHTEQAAIDELKAANEGLAQAEEWLDKNQQHTNGTGDVSGQLGGFSGRTEEHKHRMESIQRDLESNDDTIAAIKSNPLMSSGQNLAENAEKSQANLDSAEESLEKTKELLLESESLTGSLPEDISNLNVSVQQLKEIDENLNEELPELVPLVSEASTKAVSLQAQAEAINSQFGNTRLAAQDAVAARQAYDNIAKAIDEAHEAARNASNFVNEAVGPSEGKAKESQDAATLSMDLMREATAARTAVVNNLTNQLKAGQDSVEKLENGVQKGEERMEKLKMESEQLLNSDHSTQIESARTTADEAQKKLDKINEYVENEIVSKLDTLRLQGNDTVGSLSTADREMKIARQTLQEIEELTPMMMENFTHLQHSAQRSTEAVADFAHKMEALRKKVALARDIANRIKVGVSVGEESSLQLSNPTRITRSAAFTDIKLYFNTKEDGLLLYFGNEPGTSGTRAVPTDDYLAVECDQGRPKLTIDLGDGPFALTADTTITDGQWHKLEVSRTGKLVEMTVHTENENKVKTEGVATGSKSVLNLHQEQSRFYVGGVPDSARMPQSLRSRHFTGRIEDVSFHGVPVGLWNFAKDGQVNVEGAMQRDELRDEIASTGVSLSGDGYVVMNRGAWNPRKKATIVLSFRSYAKDAWILYVGKAPDFLSLELSGGRVLLQFNYGSGVGQVKSANKYNDGNWHFVQVDRENKEATLTVDQDDEVSGSSPGSMFELGTTDVYYIGGVPSDVTTPAQKPGLTGCVDRLRLDGLAVNLNTGRSAKGIEQGCPPTAIRVIGMGDEPADQTKLLFNNRSIVSAVELTLRFKTQATTGLLFHLTNEDKTNVLTLSLTDGYLLLTTQNGETKTEVKVELGNAADGHWHFVTASRSKQKIRLDVDDLYTQDSAFDSAVDWPDSVGTLHFGTAPDTSLPAFSGCLADITFNGQFLDFANATHTGVSLVGCPMEETVPDIGPADGGDSKRDSKETAETSTKAPENLGDRCALGINPLGSRDDSAGDLFGWMEGSRIEYNQIPDLYDKAGTFYLQFRASAFDGVIFFVTNQEQTDFLSLYMLDGKLVFSYDSGSGKAVLTSKRHFMDGEWHTVVAERTNKKGVLKVDEVVEAEGESPGQTQSVESLPPFYLGGLPPALQPFAARAMPGSGPTFGGCLRDLKLNGQPFVGGQAAPINRTRSCSEYTEPGLYFGDGSGWAILRKEHFVGDKFNLELEIKPRVKTAVLLAISAGEGDFLTLQLIDGEVVFSLDSGAGVQTVQSSASKKSALCDGHWHSVKAFKTKNLMSVTVDGKTKMSTFRKAKTFEINTKDSMYLGGVPDGYRTRGLTTTDAYIGCMRVLNMGGRRRRHRKSIELRDIETQGNVNKSNCPVN